MTTTLYRCFDGDGVLLYIGISKYPLRRLSSHHDNIDATWTNSVYSVKFTKFKTRRKALEEEKRAIRAEKPKFNVIHNEATKPRRRLPKIVARFKRTIFFKTPESNAEAVREILTSEDPEMEVHNLVYMYTNNYNEYQVAKSRNKRSEKFKVPVRLPSTTTVEFMMRTILRTEQQYEFFNIALKMYARNGYKIPPPEPVHVLRKP
jgi:predicted GIY-YIG superfamily endonuclease